LEAGRSGFGTVARHRAISPLLVSAIERASQFSRLPGTDAGRVIYSHRIVAVAGGRFHVLSAIRDAGADYTGRTNHIAHHLIVDPREIAQLGPDGPSPADVLLAMQWVTSWNETPRFLEAADEVALSIIHPQTNGSAWEQIAGSANQAWLLATGDAIRGAYIIQSGGIDLRAAFGESLRFIPDRLWQISFTTSLQPSDEPSEFRWIGIEEQSPLRSRSESSGRPVFNLGRPHELPLVELVQDAEKSPTRQDSAPRISPSQGGLQIDSPGLLPQALGQYHRDTSDARREDERKSATTKRESPRQSPSKQAQFAVIAIAVVAILAFFIIPKFTRERPEITAQRNQVRTDIRDALQGNDNGLAEKLANLPVSQLKNAKELASAAKKTTDALRIDNLTEPDADPVAKAQAARLNIDPSLNILFQLHNDFFKRQHKIAAIESKTTPSKQDIVLLQQIHSEIEHDNYNLSPISGDLHKRFRSKIAQIWARKLIALLKGDSLHEVDIEWFKGQISKLPGEVSKSKEAGAINTIVNKWEELDRMPPNPAIIKEIIAQPQTWPKWLVDKANRIDPNTRFLAPNTDTPSGQKAKMAPSNPPQPQSSNPQTSKINQEEKISGRPLYFVSGFEGLQRQEVEEITKGLKYFLKKGPKQSPQALIAPFQNERLTSAADQKWHFVIDESKKIIRFANDLENPVKAPFCLSARKPDAAKVDADEFQIWVISKQNDALFEKTDKGLFREGDIIRVNPELIGLTGTPKGVVLKITFPNSFPAGLKSKPINNWTADISAVRVSAEALIQPKKAQLLGLQSEKPFDDSVHQARFNELLNGLVDDGFKKDPAIDVKYLTKPEDEIQVKYAGLTKAIAGKPEDFDSLFSKAAELGSLPKTVSREEEKMKLEALRRSLEEKVGQLNAKIANETAKIANETKNQKKNPKMEVKLDADRKLFSRLKKLQEMYEHVFWATPSARSLHLQQSRKREQDVDNLTKDIEKCEAQIAKDRESVPIGMYQIYVVLDGKDFLLSEITMGEKGGK
jgi:hypothetical protein